MKVVNKMFWEYIRDILGQRWIFRVESLRLRQVCTILCTFCVYWRSVLPESVQDCTRLVCDYRCIIKTTPHWQATHQIGQQLPGEPHPPVGVEQHKDDDPAQDPPGGTQMVQKHQCTMYSAAPGYDEIVKILLGGLWQQLLPSCLKGRIFFWESGSVQNVVLRNKSQLPVAIVWVVPICTSPDYLFEQKP